MCSICGIRTKPLAALRRFFKHRFMHRQIALFAALSFLFAGCQTGPKTITDSAGVTYTKTIHNLYVSQAPAFDPPALKGKTLAIFPTASGVPAQAKADEAEQFERMRKRLRDELVYALEAENLFRTVTAAEPASHASDYALDTTIVEYYPGNPALRFTVGFGAGYPSITLRGAIRDRASETPLFLFRTQREFEARPFEYTDEQILENNIKDLARDFADYLERSINKRPLKD